MASNKLLFFTLRHNKVTSLCRRCAWEACVSPGHRRSFLDHIEARKAPHQQSSLHRASAPSPPHPRSHLIRPLVASPPSYLRDAESASFPATTAYPRRPIHCIHYTPFSVQHRHTMQIFVRNLAGASLAFDVDTSAPDAIVTLQKQVAERTGVPVAESRLSRGGLPLSDATGLVPGSTLDQSARLRGGEKKKRCAFLVGPTERCSSPALNIIGVCPECAATHCGRHRLPEDHTCPKLSEFKKTAFQMNKDKLEAEAANAGTNAHNVA